ncbi:hypothetical protein FBQ82_00665 [Anaerolineae bacterium CFX7]|nr:hypothetical protein [Anaerolineae bacterium CFX7]
MVEPQTPINLISLIIWTGMLFIPIYAVLLGTVYLARRYIPEARGIFDMAIEPILFFPAAVSAFLIALNFAR